MTRQQAIVDPEFVLSRAAPVADPHANMPRFVVLKHDPGSNPEFSLHWDLMLEDDEKLLTWELTSVPAIGQTILAYRIRDHRLAYLEYEGSIAGNRGSVSRWDTGTFRWLERRSDQAILLLSGDRLRCQATLANSYQTSTERDRDPRRIDDQRWTILFSNKVFD